MASFVMHYIAGEIFLNSLDYKLIDTDKNSFRLGNLVVDALGMTSYSRDEKLTKKLITHFRNIEDEDKCIQIPNVDKFMDKYKKLVENDYSAMGYLFHLYTDKIFFEYLYNNVIEILDKDMNKTNIKKDGIYVRVFKSNKLFKLNDFYSGSSEGGLYRDYSNMNKYLIDKYKIDFNYNELKDFSVSNFDNPGVEEIDYSDVCEVLDKMDKIITETIKRKKEELNVFKVSDIDEFISMVVKGFKKRYKISINELIEDR